MASYVTPTAPDNMATIATILQQTPVAAINEMGAALVELIDEQRQTNVQQQVDIDALKIKASNLEQLGPQEQAAVLEMIQDFLNSNAAQLGFTVTVRNVDGSLQEVSAQEYAQSTASDLDKRLVGAEVTQYDAQSHVKKVKLTFADDTTKTITLTRTISANDPTLAIYQGLFNANTSGELGYEWGLREHGLNVPGLTLTERWDHNVVFEKLYKVGVNIKVFASTTDPGSDPAPDPEPTGEGDADTL